MNDTEQFLRNALFSSYSNIAIMETRLYNQNPNHLRPTQKEIPYLYCIWNKKGCTASDLVEILQSSKALVSQTIISMEKKGYIVRTKDPEDNRRQILEVSPQRLADTQQEMEILDNSIAKLRTMYTPEDIDKAGKVLLSLTNLMVNQA